VAEVVQDEEEHDVSDVDLMKDAKVWTRGTANRGAVQKGLTDEDYEKMKNMSGEEQVRYVNGVFNFYAMDDPAPLPTQAEQPMVPKPRELAPL
jgi:hypothetical protein